MDDALYLYGIEAGVGMFLGCKFYFISGLGRCQCHGGQMNMMYDEFDLHDGAVVFLGSN